MIKRDIKIKRIIGKNINDELKIQIDFLTNTSYEIWKLLEATYLKGIKERRNENKKELDIMEYSPDDDIHLYLSNRNNKFKSLKELKEELTDEEKLVYLYKSLPLELIKITNLLSYQDSWSNSCKILNKTVPKLKPIYEKEKNKEKANAYFSESYNNNKNHNKNHQNHNPKSKNLPHRSKKNFNKNKNVTC